MKEPTLDDYGLHVSDTKRAKDAKAILTVVVLLLSLIGIVVLASLKRYGGNYRGLFTFFGVIAIPPYGPILLYYFFKCLLRTIWPSFNQVIRFEASRRAYEEWWVRTQTNFWQSLSGLQFEHELAALYQRSGTQAEVTSASDDKGVDIWLNRNGLRIPVQCKAHKKPVGPAVAREFFGAMHHFGAEEGILASISGFTHGVREYIRGKPIRLLTLSDILQMQKELR